MNSSLNAVNHSFHANSNFESDSARIREIPYNYTSYSDREIVIRFLGVEIWHVIEKLRYQRRTGQSARMLFEILGDMWIVQRNPYLQDDLLSNKKRQAALFHALQHRLHQISKRADDNPLAEQLITAARAAIEKFKAWFPAHLKIRKAISKAFIGVTDANNIDFSGLARVSHVTDASDWRVEYPTVVIYPAHEDELPQIVQVCKQLGLTIIARGGGTGYTGGAVPLLENTAVINLEKLDKIEKVKHKCLPGLKQEVPTIKAGAGAITRSVAQVASAFGYVFAVDPTSQDSSTIGGNVAMNAGGKKAVLWGTTLDNLVSWRMINAQGNWLVVERINHNLLKIHEQETVEFKVSEFDQHGKELPEKTQVIRVAGHKLRKNGLGKDVTDKFLAGIPGVQKEGCDGIISSAEFILHQYPEHTYTLCIEYFNSDLNLAVPSIVSIKNLIDENPDVVLSGLEHLDERYVKAIAYTSKATRKQLPRMVLLADLSSDSTVALDKILASIESMLVDRDAELFIARQETTRAQFWADRSRTAAIAAHTNAFKINEDVVIPLNKLADYSEGIERINIEYSLKNKIAIVRRIHEYFSKKAKEFSANDNPEVHDRKISAALELCDQVCQRWQILLQNFDQAVADIAESLDSVIAPGNVLDSSDLVINLLRRRQIRPSYRKEIEQVLLDYFSGQDFVDCRQQIQEIHSSERASRLFVATHMHAGDGNVHTNIPVNSNDYTMMREAEKIVDRVMDLATSLGGVISGEHGIGMTKIQYLDQAYLQEFKQYNQTADPQGLFNHLKLSPQGGLEKAYTPSLRLLQLEALILEESELGELNNAIRHCLRCGKCKPVCNTHVPRANLNYSPRNKILATGLIIEAFLYEEQTRRGLSTRHFTEMNDIADHCTVCHKCMPPCPVDIDFGDVSILMRHILKRRGQRKSNWGTKLSLLFLNVTKPRWIKLLRLLMIRTGYPLQRLLYFLVGKKPKQLALAPKPTTGHMKLGTQLVNFVAKPLPAKLPRKPLRSILKLDDPKYVPIVRDPAKVTEQSPALFYFPGCGSERLFSQVGLATIAVLYDLGVQLVLPPAYLCCGYPQLSAGETVKGQSITVENRVLFHRIANTLNYLDINTVLVSCGTCLDQLLAYEFNRIFPGSKLMDIHEYLCSQGVTLDGSQTTEYLYHDPCHSPMKIQKPIEVASKIMGKPVELSDRCCGEAGTFAISRPDIASQVRFRKREELQAGIEKIKARSGTAKSEIKLLTACPSCQQGLSGYQPETGLSTDYIVVELMNQRYGKQWENLFIDKINQGGIEQVLL